jgi:prefoldin subunit 2
MSTPSTSSSSSSSSSSPPSLLSPQQEVQQVIQTYKAMRANITELASKITELDSDKNEHALVIRAIQPLPPTRRCYRSIGGVLVERSVGEVLPAVERNLKGIDELISQLTRELRDKEKEADEFRVKWNIQMGESKDEDREDREEEKGQRTQRKKEGGTGVLA